MYTTIDRHGVQELVELGGQLVEVLPASAYEEQHLPRAVSLPLAELSAQAPSRLLRERSVIVYCYDHQ